MQQLWSDAITVHNYIDNLLVMAESQQEIEAGAELFTASLAILDGQAHHFYTDSWVVHKSLTLWLPLLLGPGRLACTEIPCMGTDTWQQNWPHVQEHPFKVRHVSAHQKDDSLEAQSNREVDDRTSAGEPAQAMNAHPACGHRSAPTARAWDMTHSQTPLPLCVYKTFGCKCTVCTQLHLRAFYRPWGKIKGQWALTIWQVDDIGPLPPLKEWRCLFTAVDAVSGFLFAEPTKCANQHGTIEALEQLLHQYGPLIKYRVTKEHTLVGTMSKIGLKAWE